MDEPFIREMLLTLIMDCQKHYSRATALEAVIKRTLETKNLSILEDWKSLIRSAQKQPLVKETLSAKFLPLIDFAIQGLDDAAAQELLDKIRELFPDDEDEDEE
jgi:hypothetical protein